MVYLGFLEVGWDVVLPQQDVHLLNILQSWISIESTNWTVYLIIIVIIVLYENDKKARKRKQEKKTREKRGKIGLSIINSWSTIILIIKMLTTLKVTKPRHPMNTFSPFSILVCGQGEEVWWLNPRITFFDMPSVQMPPTVSFRLHNPQLE